MVDPPREPSADGGTESEAPPGVPRWLKVSALIAGVVLLAVIAVMLISGGDHGPGRHVPEGSMPAGVEGPAVPGDAALAGGRG